MFDAAECMFLYVESSLRVGSGEERGEIDLPFSGRPRPATPWCPAAA